MTPSRLSPAQQGLAPAVSSSVPEACHLVRGVQQQQREEQTPEGEA